jgi:glycosyltransferase involved in cell wall biosynthesis
MNNKNLNKAVTCHAGNRDSYQLSVALYENGLLDALVTDFYSPDFVRDLIGKRFNNALPSQMTTSLWGDFLFQKIIKCPYDVSDARLSNYAAKKAIKHNSHLFLSSYTAYEAFSKIKAEGLPNRCLLFQLHPHPLSIRNIFKEEIKLVPVAEDSILGELEMNEDEHVLNRLINESILADSCVVASSFTKETLVENGIPENKIKVIPYGVDSLKFPAKKEYNLIDGPLNIIFVGQMIQRKGLYYLLEAVKKLNAPNVVLTIVGRGSIDQNLLDKYRSIASIKIKINLSHIDLVNEFHCSDVLIFPSLVEGFGQVILEAMSSGLPVICTPNTAGRDLFISGKEGIIVPIRDIEALAEKIEWCRNNKIELEEMGREAARTARIFTWEKFRAGIVDFYKKNHCCPVKPDIIKFH